MKAPVDATPAPTWWKSWRRRVKSRLPYVRRRAYERLQLRNAELIGLFSGAKPADRAVAVVIKPVSRLLGPEVCLFVSYSPHPRVKQHVYRHIAALQANGVEVLLVVNSPCAADTFIFEAGFVDGLIGLLVRENTGFDFAAWAHVYLLHEHDLKACSRLLLINDSIVGPILNSGITALLGRVRASKADLVGLTENPIPRLHLQSYFLAMQGEPLQAGALASFLRAVLNLPTKELVILAYETYFTARMKEAGWACEALFPSVIGPMSSLETWEDLSRQGLPYLKTDTLERHWGTEELSSLVPGDILAAYELATRK